jgi:hypothetical protein
VATTIVFTDPVLEAGVTPVRAVHVTELQTAVNAVRASAGLAAATWAESAGTGVTVKASHLEELRDAVGAARTAIGLSTASYADPTLYTQSTEIRKAHIEQLRGNVQ